jgi:hypothetical protein
MKKYLLSIGVLIGLLLPNFLIAQTSGTLSFSFTPVAHTGSWGSKHVLAVWVQDNSDGFIRTEHRYWGNGTKDELPNWKSNSNQNVVDAVTGPTLSSYTTKSFQWDGTDLSGNLLPDGDYKITIEECWSHGSSKVTKSFTFTKSDTEFHLTPENDANFTDVIIDWVPSTIGIDEMENTKMFSVFPNPTDGKITIDFKEQSKNCKITILNNLGQKVYIEKEVDTSSGIKSIDISRFKNGIYFLNVELDSKIYTKKIVMFR